MWILRKELQDIKNEVTKWTFLVHIFLILPRKCISVNVKFVLETNNLQACSPPQAQVQRLVRREQLEFVSGGWVMPDEATTHYGAVLDQLVEGHQWLERKLGIRPENVWSIDPFGHSGTLPYLWRLSGMRNLVIQRVHQSVKAALSERHALEFYWRQAWDSSDLGAYGTKRRRWNLFALNDFNAPMKIAAEGSAITDILCHVMPYMQYSIPYSCGPLQHVCQQFDFEPENDVKDITSITVALNARALVSQFRAKASLFQLNVILVPIGDDFRYDRQLEWDRVYSNYEKLMHHMNNKEEWNLDVRWGTLKDFFELVRLEEKKHTKVNLPILSGDFFPYSDRYQEYWSGYFTTRPFDKYFSRDLQFLISAADQLNTLSYALYLKWGKKQGAESRFSHLSSMLQQARRSLALFQHHDAITGTAKGYVVVDYEEHLLAAYNQSQNIIRRAFQGLLTTEDEAESPVEFHPVVIRAHHGDIPRRQVLPVSSACRGTLVTFYNPLGHIRSEVISLLVDSPAVQVISSQAKRVLSIQVSPVWSTKQDGAVVEENIFEISFEVSMFPFSLVTIMVSKLPGNIPLSNASNAYFSRISVYGDAVLIVTPSLPFVQASPRPDWYEDILVSNDVIELAIDPKTGSLIRLTHLKSGHTTRLDSSFQFYTSRKSGAYILSPTGEADPLFPTSKRVKGKISKPLFSTIPKLRVLKGDFVTFIDITFHSSTFQRITLYSQPPHLAGAIFIENVLSIQMLINKEIVFRFDTDIANCHRSYFTDQNGFQFIRRQTLPDQPIEANYYPMTSGVILQDTNSRLTLLSAQSHGTASLKQGQVEIMLDRHLTTDDFRGLGEGIEDIKTTTSRFAILTETFHKRPEHQESSLSASLSLPALVIQDSLNQPVLAYFSLVDSDVFLRSLTPVSLSALPCDVTAVSMRSLVTDNFEYNGTTLVLHQRGFDSSLQPTWVEGPALFCAPSNPNLTMDSVFGEFSYSNLRETSLTATFGKRLFSPTEKLSLKPMEISAFYLFFVESG